MKFFDVLLKYSKVFKKWFVKQFWPWFVKNIWPKIKEYVEALLVYLSSEIFRKIKEWWDNRNKTRDSTIETKISEAEHKAKISVDPIEIEKQKAIADVWREVAEMYRKENEEMKKKNEEIQKQTMESSLKLLDNVEIDFKAEKDDTVLFTIGDIKKIISLPPHNE